MQSLPSAEPGGRRPGLGARWSALVAGLVALRDRHGTVSPSGFSTNAEVVLWQNELRVVISAVVAVIATVLRVTGIVAGSPLPIAIVVPCYIAVVGLTSLLVRRTKRAGTPLLLALVAADIAVIYATVALVTLPAYYPRALLLSLVALQFTQFVLGVLPSIAAVAGAGAGYVLLLAVAVVNGHAISWGEQLWMLSLFLVVGITTVMLLAGRNRRLTTLVDLFAQAERGDFTLEYQDVLDRRPDGITLLGRSYNHFRSELAALVLRDPLTGCMNRRGFEQELERTVARSARYGGEVSLLAIDVDHFKRVNDTYGHLAGDAVLRDLAHCISSAARAGDVVARVGGEEFIILLPRTDGESAGVVAERVMDLVRAHQFEVLHDGSHLTVSIGIATEQVVDSAIASALRARADEALYVAKRLGRDRVVLWAPGIRTYATPPWVPTIELGLPRPRTSRG